MQLYYRSGNIVRELLYDPLSTGRCTVPWDGTDNSGEPAAAGRYVMRINVDTDSDSAEDTSVSRLVQVVLALPKRRSRLNGQQFF